VFEGHRQLDDGAEPEDVKGPWGLKDLVLILDRCKDGPLRESNCRVPYEGSHH
jgi:hypothetical protein